MLDFDAVPRAMGNPNQIIVHSKDELYDYIRNMDGKAPVFTSHNSYATFLDPKNPTAKNVLQINVTKLFFDFDDKEKPEHAQYDLIKLLDWCDTENFPILPAFSGVKGFHAYILVKPQVFLANEGLSRMVKAIHLWLEKKLEFRTMDEHCKDPKRLCRVLYSKYVSVKSPVWNGVYCCPLTPEQVRYMHINDIKEYAKAPKKIQCQLRGKLLTLDEFLERFSIDVDEVLKAERKEDPISICKYIPINNTLIQKYFIDRPCIQNQLVNNREPRHVARVAAVIILKDIGFDRGWVFQFWKGLKTVDFDAGKTAYQINQIFDSNYRRYSCQTLKEGGICIGREACNKYCAGVNLKL